ncbi:MAG TPA: hypothetical protein PKW95_22310 [bacterium]|nr:hypothetical protein [bacterium]
MRILVLDREGNCHVRRPYLAKINSPQNNLEDLVWIGHTDAVDFALSSAQALDKLQADQYEGVILNCGASDGVQLMRRIRATDAGAELPVTIL